MITVVSVLYVSMASVGACCHDPVGSHGVCTTTPHVHYKVIRSALRLQGFEPRSRWSKTTFLPTVSHSTGKMIKTALQGVPGWSHLSSESAPVC